MTVRELACEALSLVWNHLSEAFSTKEPVLMSGDTAGRVPSRTFTLPSCDTMVTEPLFFLSFFLMPRLLLDNSTAHIDDISTILKSNLVIH